MTQTVSLRMVFASPERDWLPAFAEAAGKVSTEQNRNSSLKKRSSHVLHHAKSPPQLLAVGFPKSSRGDKIRTCDLTDPKRGSNSRQKAFFCPGFR